MGETGEMLRQYTYVIQVHAGQSHWRNPTTGRSEYGYTHSSLTKPVSGVVDIPVLHEKTEGRLVIVAALVFRDQERR